MRTIEYIVILFSISNLVACGDNYQQFSQSVINGRKVEKNQLEAKSTVAILTDTEDVPRFICTGTLISPRVVITATHCLYDISKSIDMKETRYVYFGLDLPKDFKSMNAYPIETFALHPDLTEKPGVEKTEETIAKSMAAFKQNDIAVIILNKDAPKGYIPVPILQNTSYLKIGMSVNTAGVGSIEDSEDAYSSEMNQTELTIVGFNQNILIVDQTKNTGVCHGDSGGPAYLKTPIGLVLVGATKGPHGLIDTCLQLGEFTLFGPQVDTILKMLVPFQLKQEWMPRFIQL